MPDHDDVKELLHELRPDLKESPVLTFDEALALLKTSKSTLLRALKRGEVPARRLGREWRFHRDTLLTWLQGADIADK